MREFKFRGWNKKRKSMGGVFVFDDLYHAGMMGYETIDNKKKFIIMQYTGLKDKNGKEIYEGDIIRFPIVEQDLDEPTVSHDYKTVIWEQETCSFILTDFGGRLIKGREYEIIGNIYENPELMEDK